MAVDNVGSSDASQARILAQKKRAIDDEKNALEADRARAERERGKQATVVKEKIDKEIVEISKQGEKQAELVKKLNSERVQSLNDNTQKEYLRIADNTAKEIQRMDADALNKINNHRNDRLEKLKLFEDRSEDPFYRLKGLNPVLSETEKEFTVKIAIAAHEAQNLYASGEGTSLKLSLARRFQDQVKDLEKLSSTKTSSYQTVVETLTLPSGFEPKGIRREYADGVLTLFVPKTRPPMDMGPLEKFDTAITSSS
jgi:HSP20 family molecular chaperone IbpA